MKKPLESDQSTTFVIKNVNLSVKGVVIDLEITTVLLTFLSVAGQSLKYLSNYDKAFCLITLVNMAKALSIPTIFGFWLHLLPRYY